MGKHAQAEQESRAVFYVFLYAMIAYVLWAGIEESYKPIAIVVFAIGGIILFVVKRKRRKWI